MGDGTEKKPYTREDVLRLIKKHGGPEGLDLSGKTFEASINLSNLNLRGIILNGANLSGFYPPPDFDNASFWVDESPQTKGAHLEGAYLVDASLKGAELSDVHFERAILASAHLEEACLGDAHLEEAELTSSHLEKADLRFAHLERSRLIVAHLEKAELSEAHLQEAVLIEANLEEAYLYSANLKGADLAYANLLGATLKNANLKGADLTDANLVGTYLEDAKFDSDTKLEHVNWRDYILPEEKRGEESKGEERGSWFGSAADNYRRLKTWYTEHGLYDVAGKLFYREMEARRKAQTWKKEPHLKLWSWILKLLCGYGEKPQRVAISAAAIVFGLAAAYFFWGSFSSTSFWDTLYYSVASFTALGYGQWAPQPTGWAKGVGAAEAVIGVSMIALFLVTFTRKMIR